MVITFANEKIQLIDRVGFV